MKQMELMSHPSWVCGLKLKPSSAGSPLWSHTLRGCVDWNYKKIERGDELYCHTLRGCVDWNKFILHPLICLSFVTPFVGVWIETCWMVRCVEQEVSHTLRGCVDWNIENSTLHTSIFCHTLRGCVDWNDLLRYSSSVFSVTPFVGVWIETSLGCCPGLLPSVTPFVGVWIETCHRKGNTRGGHVTPFVGVWIETCWVSYAWHKYKSHPSWVCGLKPPKERGRILWQEVTPFVGVWIETV